MKPDQGHAVFRDGEWLSNARNLDECRLIHVQAGNRRNDAIRSRATISIAGCAFAGILTLILIATECLSLQADDSLTNRPTFSTKNEIASTNKDNGKSNKIEVVDSKKADQKDEKKEGVSETKRPSKVVKTNAEWKRILQPLPFRVARLKETEPAFTNKYWNNKRSGKYACICCGEELYRSDEKFDSGTGWPSFWAPVSERAIATENDYSGNVVRTEVHCDRCGAHLGHIFDDGPQPTGMRHCINSASLKFVPADASKTK